MRGAHGNINLHFFWNALGERRKFMPNLIPRSGNGAGMLHSDSHKTRVMNMPGYLYDDDGYTTIREWGAKRR